MCGRYAVFTEEENQEIREIIKEINERYKNDSSSPSFKTGEIFPTDRVPILTIGPVGKPVANLFKWGFPGFNQKVPLIINARSETIEVKPSFKRLVASNRCLVPASAFYEWKTTPQGKEKYIIRAEGHSMFYMAGLYNSFTDTQGNPINCFVIITVDADEAMSQVHSRMPVILERRQSHLWLESPLALSSLLKPYENPLSIKRAL